MDAYPQGRDLVHGRGPVLGQGSTQWQDEPDSYQSHHTPRYRQVSGSVQQQQPPNSSVQEGMHQDSNVDPASTTAVLGEGPDSKRDSLQHSFSFSNHTTRQEEPGKRSDRSTGHVGIMIDDHQQQHGGDPGHGRVTHSHTQGGRGITFEQGHSPVGSPITVQSQAQDVLPPAAGHSTRGSHHSNMFQQGYYQEYQGHPPGAVLSRHLSIQLPPNATFLPPPPPPVAHSGSLAMHPSYSLDGSFADSALSHVRECAVPPQSNVSSNQPMGSWRSLQSSSQQNHPHQYLHHQGHQHQHRQQHSPSQQSVAVPPPPIKYIRSPMRSPNIQLSSQAMAYAQAQAQAQSQSQSQYRHHSSYHHGAVQSQHQFPPRTHRRSIQPLTLDQQQPKGGSFRFVRNQADLWPQKGSQKYRSIDDYGHSISPMRALTVLLTRTYSHCNREFKYESSYNPRRVLTKPSKPMHNEGYDNEDYDYILYVSDILGSEERQRYLILDVLGQGTFGQVVKCQNLKTNAIVAVKVIKNRPAYFNQSMMEVTVLELLNERYDVDDRHHILRLYDTFIHRRHLCLVFELLSVNLYELIKQNQFRGLSMSLVRVLTAQLLDALCVLNEARIIHCDLKPENVLLKNLETPTIKVIDFGSACHEQQTVYTYIQSRFYRSPEVLVGLPYSSSIDIWSVGCIAAELFLGLPLFPGSSEYNQLSRIVEMLGMLPTYMLDIGKTAHEFFEVIRPEHTSHGYNRSSPKKYRLKSIDIYSREHKVMEQPSKRYFQATTLPDIINSYPMQKKGMTSKEIEKEMMNRQSFINFLQGLLNLNPIERWSPHQAKLHPFITGESFTGSFVPPTIPKKPPTAENSIRLEPTMPGRSSKARSASLSSSSTTATVVASSLASMTSEAPRQHVEADPTLSSSHLQASKSGASPIGIRPLSPLSALEGPPAPPRDSPGSSPSAPLVKNDGSSPAVADGTRSSNVSGSHNKASQDSAGHQSTTMLPSSGPSHHGHRPRATTMGTVEVPKNMAQLAAAMTPQQGPASGGISGTSGHSRRTEPDDPATAEMFEPSSPYLGALGGLGSIGHGLNQIPERSEQNSPVHEGSTGVNSGASSPQSQRESQDTQLSYQQQQQQQDHQYQARHYLQRPHRYLHRSGSDAGSMTSAHTFRSAVGGASDHGSLQAGGQGNNFVESLLSSNVSEAPATTSELTPLQRMQQQLNQSQAQQKHEQQQPQQQQQQQQQHGFHFGYPQSGSSPSEGSGSISGVDSNSSSRQDHLSEPEFYMDGGTLRQMDLGGGHIRNSRSPMIYGIEEVEDLDEQDSCAGNEASSGQGRSGIKSDSASGRSSSLYSPGRSSASPYSRSADGLDSPNFESLTDNGPITGTDPLILSTMATDTTHVPGTFDTGLSNVEEEEEEEEDEQDEEDEEDEEEKEDNNEQVLEGHSSRIQLDRRGEDSHGQASRDEESSHVAGHNAHVS